MDAIDNPARRRLEGGGVSLGVALRFARTVDIAPMMRAAGYDWLFIDLEHGSMSLDAVAQITTAALACGIAPLVRVPKGEYSLATRALDNGALGIILPHVDNAADAREAVARLKLPPLGHRSIGPAPQLQFRSVPLPDSLGLLNRACMTVLMLETPEAVARADEIAAVEGVDVVMIGTNDLCAEMGIPGQYGDPRVAAAYDALLAACARHGKWPGMGGIYDDTLAPHYIASGVRFVLAGMDQSFLMSAATARVRVLSGPRAI
jgi:4-hydroxy-2-oxoheptanedioate aldolase